MYIIMAFKRHFLEDISWSLIDLSPIPSPFLSNFAMPLHFYSPQSTSIAHINYFKMSLSLECKNDRKHTMTFFWVRLIQLDEVNLHSFLFKKHKFILLYQWIIYANINFPLSNCLLVEALIDFMNCLLWIVL